MPLTILLLYMDAGDTCISWLWSDDIQDVATAASYTKRGCIPIKCSTNSTKLDIKDKLILIEVVRCELCQRQTANLGNASAKGTALVAQMMLTFVIRWAFDDK